MLCFTGLLLIGRVFLYSIINSFQFEEVVFYYYNLYLFYPFRCQILFLLFIYKPCSFFPVSHFFACLIPCKNFLFKMSVNEFFHVFLGRPLFPFPVILVCHIFLWVCYYSSSSNDQTTWIVACVFSSVLVQLSVLVSPFPFLSCLFS